MSLLSLIVLYVRAYVNVCARCAYVRACECAYVRACECARAFWWIRYKIHGSDKIRENVANLMF